MIWIIVIIIISAVFLLSGCKKPVKPTITGVLLSVPYEKVGGKDWCLPASGAMVFSYHGENISQAVIANKVITNGNSSSFKLVSYARELGFVAAWKRTSITDIERYLREGIPLIVIQKYSMIIKNTHARVIIGFDSVKHELTLHDSVDGSNYKMSYKAFFDLGFDSSKMSQVIMIKRNNKQI
jgi:ABC-type bacteriocin/lantibiotic exporter with double-glycine peptidase domain